MDNVTVSYEIARLVKFHEKNNLDVNMLALMIEGILNDNEDKPSPYADLRDGCVFEKGKY